jgi:predicted ATP-dependent endonuclease of OLD family
LSLHIKKFRVYGFLGTYDVDIPISDNVKILVGENGIGKTQLLNIFYFTLSKRFDRLISQIFNYIILEFDDGSTSVISKQAIVRVLTRNNHPLVSKIIEKIGIESFLSLRTRVLSKNLGRFVLRLEYPGLKEIATSDGLLTLMRESNINILVDEVFSPELFLAVKSIDLFTEDTNILYFPTYRRVEEDLFSLGYNEESFRLDKDDNRVIHFGMEDVQARFEGITRRIGVTVKEGFSKLSSEILSQLIRGVPQVDRDLIDNLEPTDVQIILNRIGGDMNPDDKAAIIEMVSKKEMVDKNVYLLFLLQELIKVYKEQSKYDTAIKEFVNVSNSYLVNKEVVYDQSRLRIYIQSKENTNKILLSKLSSGEKQIISLFAKIYLTTAKQQYIVLFDEPELSLSIFWQRKLLPDIMQSQMCRFLLTVTHSPFIFENELDQYAVGLTQYYKKIVQNN